MTKDQQSPLDSWIARNFATPPQKIRWWLIFWAFCLLIAPLMVMDGHDRIGTRIFIIGATCGWIPALLIFVKYRKSAQDAAKDDNS